MAVPVGDSVTALSDRHTPLTTSGRQRRPVRICDLVVYPRSYTRIPSRRPGPESSLASTTLRNGTNYELFRNATVLFVTNIQFYYEYLIEQPVGKRIIRLYSCGRSYCDLRLYRILAPSMSCFRRGADRPLRPLSEQRNQVERHPRTYSAHSTQSRTKVFRGV